jgi:putative spermidine/putrescine transport system ATP-binding protein
VIAPPAQAIDAPLGIPGTVVDVEYQGTYVLLGLQARDTGGQKEVSVMLPEAQFAARRYATGEAVHLSWAQHNAHALPA